MSYRVRGLSAEPFRPYFGLSDSELASQSIDRCRVEAFPGFPCRIEMRDLEPGETALRLNYEHLPLTSPYRARHAIFVGEGAQAHFDEIGVVPEVLKRRVIALRAFDARGFMLDADIAKGNDVEPLILKLQDHSSTSCLHAHNARRGCYAGRLCGREERQNPRHFRGEGLA